MAASMAVLEFYNLEKMATSTSIFSHSFPFKLGIISALALSNLGLHHFLLSPFPSLCHSLAFFRNFSYIGTRILHRLMKAP
jgi:hypothetical protein